MSQFDKFMQSSDQLIQNAATMVDQATTEYNNKNLTLFEYKEICSDVLDFEHISMIVTDMIRKQEIYNAFQEISSIVSIVSSL